VDRGWEKLGYQDATLKLYHHNAERGLLACAALPAGPVRARLPHRLTALHQLLQHGTGSGARPAEGALASSPAEATSMVPRKRRATCRRRATSSTSPPPRVEGARGQLQHPARPAGTDLLGAEAGAHQRPAQLHHHAEKRAPPRLPPSPTAWRSTAAGSRPLASSVSATRLGWSLRHMLTELQVGSAWLKEQLHAMTGHRGRW
jgi:hypothetical protein